jgi:hypothetical protein
VSHPPMKKRQSRRASRSLAARGTHPSAASAPSGHDVPDHEGDDDDRRRDSDDGNGGGGGDHILGSFVLKPGNAKMSVEPAVDALTVDPSER